MNSWHSFKAERFYHIIVFLLLFFTDSVTTIIGTAITAVEANPFGRSVMAINFQITTFLKVVVFFVFIFTVYLFYKKQFLHPTIANVRAEGWMWGVFHGFFASTCVGNVLVILQLLGVGL